MESVYDKAQSPCKEKAGEICDKLEELNFELEDLIKVRDNNKLNVSKLSHGEDTSKQHINDVKKQINNINTTIKSYEPEMIVLQAKLSTIMKKIKKEEEPQNKELKKYYDSKKFSNTKSRQDSSKVSDSKNKYDSSKISDSKNKRDLNKVLDPKNNYDSKKNTKPKKNISNKNSVSPKLSVNSRLFLEKRREKKNMIERANNRREGNLHNHKPCEVLVRNSYCEVCNSSEESPNRNFSLKRQSSPPKKTTTKPVNILKPIQTPDRTYPVRFDATNSNFKTKFSTAANSPYKPTVRDRINKMNSLVEPKLNKTHELRKELSRQRMNRSNYTSDGKNSIMIKGLGCKSNNQTPYTSYKEIFDIQNQLQEYNKLIHKKCTSPSKSSKGSIDNLNKYTPKQYRNVSNLASMLHKRNSTNSSKGSPEKFKNNNPNQYRNISNLTTMLHERSQTNDSDLDDNDNYVKKPHILPSTLQKKSVRQDSQAAFREDSPSPSPDTNRYLKIDYESSVQMSLSENSKRNSSNEKSKSIEINKKNNFPKKSIKDWLTGLKNQAKEYSRANSPEKNENFNDSQNKRSINYLLNKFDPKTQHDNTSKSSHEEDNLPTGRNVKKLAYDLALQKNKSRSVSRSRPEPKTNKNEPANSLLKDKTCNKDNKKYPINLGEKKSDNNYNSPKNILSKIISGSKENLDEENKSMEEDTTHWKLPNNKLSTTTPPLFFQGQHKMNEKMQKESPTKGKLLKSIAKNDLNSDSVNSNRSNSLN